MENKKSKKNQSDNRGVSPKEFLAIFISSNDKKIIQNSFKNLVYHLYNTALKLPVGLRRDIQRTTVCLGPAVENDEEPIYKVASNYLNIQTSLLDILQQYGVIRKYKLEERYAKSIELTFPPHLMLFADIEFYPLNAISYYEDYKKSGGQILYKISADEPIFDGLNGVIHFGNKIYSFQKGRKSQQRLTFFKEFWGERKVVKNGKIKREGMLLPLETIAVRLGLVDSAQNFFREQGKEIRKKLRLFIKNINTNLRRKGMPIKITVKEGIQIVVTL